MNDDTIVAISSAFGSGLKGIIRISGAQAFPLISQFWEREIKPQSYRKLEGKIRLETWHCQFPVTLFLMKGPHSYTSEDCVEIHTFSSPLLLKTLVQQIVSKGARPAGPGEYTRRAFEAGRIDLAQAESVARLISAGSEAERRMAIFGVTGALSQKISQLQDNLAYVIALMEAHIDFLEEEVPALDLSQVASRLDPVLEALRELDKPSKEIYQESVQVCLYGLPNSGKSTLFNCLAEEKRALTSPVSGTTLDWLEHSVCWEGISFNFIDTPGIDELPQGLHARAQEKVPELLQGADITLYLVDLARPFEEHNHQLISQLSSPHTLLVGTKSDLEKCLDQEKMKEKSGIEESLLTSTSTSEGIEKLKKWLLAKASEVKENKNPSLLNARQHHCAQKASLLIEESLEGLHMGMSYEFITSDLRVALDFLGEISGKITSEDILGRIFSEFCIGK